MTGPDLLAGISMAPSSLIADVLGVSRSTLHMWSITDAVLAGCILRRTARSTWWSVQRLRDRGYLHRLPVVAAAVDSQAVAS
jgi:hypothetical protein